MSDTVSDTYRIEVRRATEDVNRTIADSCRRMDAVENRLLAALEKWRG